MRLALALGKSAWEVEATIPAYERAEWAQFYRQTGGFGEEKEDLRAAVIASTVANGALQKKDKKLFSPKDFIPFFRPQTQRDRNPPSYKQFRAMFGGKDA